MILLHAVTRALVDATDVGGWQVRTSGPVSVLFSESGPPARADAAVLAHGRRITALAEQLTLLPMRYGTTVDSPDDLDGLMAERADEWSRRLDVVEGHGELLLHVAEPATIPEPGAGSGRAATGREYLRRRAEALNAHDRIWEAVVDAVRPHAREHRALPDGRRLAVLVRPEREALVRTAVATAARHQGRSVAVTGPWPPFSFCDEPPDRG